jgi:hypothetical protein
MWKDDSTQKLIEGLKEEQPDKNYIQQKQYKGKQIKVMERWYRSNELRRIAVDRLSGETFEMTPEHIDNPNFEIISKNIATINMCTTAGDVLLYDGPNPLGLDIFPFIPFFGWYSPDITDWTLRVQGIVRVLKDSQREKNKRRSQIMQAVLSLPFARYFVKKGAIDDTNQLANNVNGVAFIELNDMAGVQQVNQPPLPESLVSLEQMHTQDMREIGPNPDILGDQMSKSEPGMNIQMRMKQGMTSLQEPFENAGFAKRQLGKILIEIINSRFSKEKIERIINRELPESWEKDKENYVIDTSVDEVADTPSYRQYQLAAYSSMIQQGVPIPPRVLVDKTDVSTQDKNKIYEVLDLQDQVTKMTAQLQILQLQQQINAIQNPPPPPPPAPAQIPQGIPAGDQGAPMEQAMPSDQTMPTDGVPMDIAPDESQMPTTQMGQQA